MRKLKNLKELREKIIELKTRKTSVNEVEEYIHELISQINDTIRKADDNSSYEFNQGIIYALKRILNEEPKFIETRQRGFIKLKFHPTKDVKEFWSPKVHVTEKNDTCYVTSWEAARLLKYHPDKFSLIERTDLRFIEHLRDIHKGEEIWIVGSSPILDEYPEDFLNDKISIVLAFSCLVFPNATYIHIADIDIMEYILSNHPELLDKCIIPVAYEPLLGSLVEKPIYMRTYSGSRREFEQDCKAVAEMISKNRPYFYPVCTSCLHTAIFAAVIMGAKRITLVACDAKLSKEGKYFADKVNKALGTPDRTTIYTDEQMENLNNTLNTWRKQIEIMKKIFKDYGVEIRHHRT